MCYYLWKLSNFFSGLKGKNILSLRGWRGASEMSWKLFVPNEFETYNRLHLWANNNLLYEIFLGHSPPSPQKLTSELLGTGILKFSDSGKSQCG